MSVITRFKNRLRNFCKGRGGFGVVEAAFTLPIFLGLTFATIDYGLLLADRSSAAGNISSLTRTIQDNPGISKPALDALIANAGGGRINFTSEAAGNCFCARPFTTQAAAQAFVNETGCGTGCNTATRDTGTATPRYIGVRGQVTYNFITPVNKIFVGSNTKVLKFGQVVPVGITICPAGQALTSAGVCAATTTTCGAGQVLSSSNTCVNATVTCGAGQFLTASGTCSSAVPVCNGAGQALQFDGANWSCRTQAITTADCYVTNIFSQRQSPNYAASDTCAPGYFINRMEHWDAPAVGFCCNDDEAFRFQCCRMQVN